MSVRFLHRAPAPAAAPAQPVAAPMFNLPNDRLYNVLHAAHNGTAADLTDDSFEATVHHEVEERGARMKMSKEQRKKMKQDALKMAREKGKYAGKQMERGSKYAAEKTKQGAKNLVDVVQRSWAGAKKPAHWVVLSASDLSKRLSVDYKRAIEKLGWENIKLASDATRVLYAETGANMHAVITISREEVRVSVRNSMIGFDEELTGSKTFGSAVSDISFSQFTKITDSLIKDLVQSFKSNFGK
jgi:hypothetical protein